jgi:hypothetical protein
MFQQANDCPRVSNGATAASPRQLLQSRFYRQLPQRGFSNGLQNPVNERYREWVLKNSFQGISTTKFVRRLLNIRSRQTLKFAEITALVPFSTATRFITNWESAMSAVGGTTRCGHLSSRQALTP